MAPSYTHQNFECTCRSCGEQGFLSITIDGRGDWSFAPAGFIGLAVNRSNPSDSVLRCITCGSSGVDVTGPV